MRQGDAHEAIPTGACKASPPDAYEARPIHARATDAHAVRSTSACASCLRRSWLLTVLSARLDNRGRGRDRERLVELLALDDETLLRALGGRRQDELKARYAEFQQSEIEWAEGVEAVCRHHRDYPRALAGANGPRMLYVSGGVDRLGDLSAAPVVAIVGSRRATDYGMEIAKGIARGLAASGATVAAGLADGISVAAHAGALEGEGKTLAVLEGGLDVACPARRRGLYGRIVNGGGCTVTELPCGYKTRRWGLTASARIVVGLSKLTVLVEAGESDRELAIARIAQAQSRTVAAVPGRVTSPVSKGTHQLLMEGTAQLVRGPRDVLDLLYGMGAPPRNRCAAGAQVLEPRLQTTLERVGAGRNTQGKLTDDGENVGEVLLALSELELMGLLARGDGGRYVLREPLPV